ncbi:hemerythrin domain-containing protein [Paracidovorax wautersii]|jgi:hemerythrin-like domain-containing protein|uniref:Hemerythrin-like domain-containing protein n=1 Tax=Paracidovorax wautersii TaxID=1177982 RepID=A0A1I2DZ81_9BURK|nr:hemerythrin domain-containing protein [Paracidovorax wautersii]GAO20733.1 hemerythrin HHE cation binding region [Alicycliphilus sp. B1]SFE85726.1 Hemerythrin-like domain-containing protein [Paracidovorax wautersii]
MTEPRTLALNTIRAEHGSLSAVVRNLRDLLAELRGQRAAVDFPLLWSMVYYIDAFPDRLHHPKEDQWLFRLLRARTGEADALIDELQRQHAHEPRALGEIRRHLGNLEAGVPASMEMLERTVATYAEFTWRHIRAEEQELIPLAETHLTPADWAEIAGAFCENADPLSGFGEADAFRQRFREIVQRTPAPLGLA